MDMGNYRSDLGLHEVNIGNYRSSMSLYEMNKSNSTIAVILIYIQWIWAIIDCDIGLYEGNNRCHIGLYEYKQL